MAKWKLKINCCPTTNYIFENYAKIEQVQIGLPKSDLTTRFCNGNELHS